MQVVSIRPAGFTATVCKSLNGAASSLSKRQHHGHDPSAPAQPQQGGLGRHESAGIRICELSSAGTGATMPFKYTRPCATRHVCFLSARAWATCSSRTLFPKSSTRRSNAGSGIPAQSRSRYRKLAHNAHSPHLGNREGTRPWEGSTSHASFPRLRHWPHPPPLRLVCAAKRPSLTPQRGLAQEL